MASQDTYIDVSYYECLGIDKGASQKEIKKAFYAKARLVHPDKNQSDPCAEEHFKALSEAYSILSDESKRALYDKYGRTGSQRPHQQAPDRDGSDIETAATMMFGAGLFANEFGTLSFGIPKMYEFSPKVLETIDGSTLARLRAEDIHRRAVELRHVLVQQLDKGSSESEIGWEVRVRKSAAAKAAVPGGSKLLDLVGYVYTQEARKVESTWAGKLLEEFQVSARRLRQSMRVNRSVMEFRTMNKSFEEHNQGLPLSGKQHIQLTECGMAVLWNVGMAEIDCVVRKVCKLVLQDGAISKKARKDRSRTLRKLGDIYREVAASRR